VTKNFTYCSLSTLPFFLLTLNSPFAIYLVQAAEECTSVLELDREHAGALMLRAQTLVTLKDYQSALFDVNRLIEINPSSEVYRNLHARLKTQLVCFHSY
jgi:tetratricopeptide (TPR) repeat protein